VQVWELLRDQLLSGATEEVGRDAEEDEVVDLCRILFHLTTTHGPQAVLAVSGHTHASTHCCYAVIYFYLCCKEFAN
jgi:hypothetical protein